MIANLMNAHKNKFLEGWAKSIFSSVGEDDEAMKIKRFPSIFKFPA